MVRPTRRKTLIGMGMLAVGSGAAFSNAAFQTSTTPSADLRVVVEEALNFRPNPDAPDDNDNILDTDDFEDFFEGEDIADGEGDAFDGDVETPLAATNGQPNGDLELFAVAGLGETATFSELFILENDSTDSVAVGIAYDRGNSDFDTDAASTGQYGGDIDVNGEGGLPPAIPRSSYRFVVNQFTDGSSVNTSSDFIDDEDNGGVISPADNGDVTHDLDESGNGEVNSESDASFVGGDNGIGNFRDRPTDAIILDPGQAVTIDLEVDINYSDPVSENIREVAGISLDGFGSERATVDLLDGITVGTLTGEPSQP